MKVSIIYTTWSPDAPRSKMMRLSIASLLKTFPEAEILVADNGGSLEDSKFLVALTDSGSIATYVRFRKNMHFAYARNVLMQQCTGDFIVVMDNDVELIDGALQDCVAYLERNPGKYMATPLKPDNMHIKGRYVLGELDGWKLNARAGSNCFVMSRASYEEIGLFPLHNLAGSKYVDHYCTLGYKMACMPVPKAQDMGFRAGYDFRNPTYSVDL